MKRMTAVAFLVAPLVFAADAPHAKRDLVRELLGVIDIRAVTEEVFDVVFDRGEREMISPDSVPEEVRQDYERIVAERAETRRALRREFMLRLDHAKYADEVYVPMFEKTFTAPELEQLIEFYKTAAGRKSSTLFPQLVANSLTKCAEQIDALRDEVSEAVEDAENAAKPWRKTMADLRMMATASEAYATDTNQYPNVTSYEALAEVLTPTYIRALPPHDTWGTAYSYSVSPDLQHYRFASAGADRHFDWSSQQYDPTTQARETDSLDEDLIYQDGTFLRYPKMAPKQY